MARTFDQTELLARVDNNTAFLAETVDMLTSDGPPLLDQLRRALAAGDTPAVSCTAHSIKGMVSNFCATRAYAAAQRVEQFGKSGDLVAAPAAARRSTKTSIPSPGNSAISSRSRPDAHPHRRRRTHHSSLLGTPARGLGPHRHRG